MTSPIVPETTLAAITRSLAESGLRDAVAVVDDDSSTTFGTLDRRARSLAGELVRLGLGDGERIGAWLPNGRPMIELLVAASYAGSVVVLLNTKFRPGEVTEILTRTRAKALVVDPDFLSIPFLEHARQVRADVAHDVRILVTRGDGAGESAASDPAGTGSAVDLETAAGREAPVPVPMPVPASAERPLLMLVTSGTTSAPKLVVHSDGRVAAHARDVGTAFGYREPSTCALVAHPICGALGLANAMALLVSGATMWLPARFDPAAYARILVDESVTDIMATDQIMEAVLAGIPEHTPLPALRKITFGSFRASPAEFVRLAESRGLMARGVFGTSETQAMLCLQPEDRDVERRGIGGGVLADRNGEVRAVDAETGSEVPHGELGLLEFRTPNVMLGYFEDPEMTSRVLDAQGFLRTGDLGTVSADGAFEFVSRRDDALRLGGFLVGPVEVANLVRSHPDVVDCLVAGVKESYASDVAVAFVTTRPGSAFSEDVIRAHCRSLAAAYKTPRRVVVVDELPVVVGPNGSKPDLKRLRSMAKDVDIGPR